MAERKRCWWPILLILVAVLAVAGVLAARYAASGFYSATTEVTEADFRYNAERLTFVRNVLPFKVSDDVQVEKIHLVEWLDANFSCVLRLPSDEFQAVQGEIEADWYGDQGENRFENAKWKYTAVLDDREKTIVLRASSQPGH